MKSMLSVCLFVILFSAIKAEVESEDNAGVKADIISTLTKNAETNLNRARRAAPNPANCVEFTDRSSGKKFLQCEDAAPVTTSINMPPMAAPMLPSVGRPMGINQVGISSMGVNQPMQRQWLQRAASANDDDMSTFLQAPQPVNNVGSGARGAYSSYSGSSYSAPSYSAPVQGYGPCPQKMLFSCQPTVVSVPCQPDSYAAPSYSAPAPSYSAPAYSAPAQSYSAPAYSAPAPSY